MGNSGSAHNLHNERSINDHNTYYQPTFQQTLHRQYQTNRSGFRSSPNGAQRSLTTEWRRSYPSAGPRVPKLPTDGQIKVLPELDKRLHLRATTNGAILNSGGTISGRKLNENSFVKSPNALSQRSQTFINEPSSSKDGLYRKAEAHPEFTRSQTLLYVKAKTNEPALQSTKSNLSRMQRHTYSEPELINKLNNEGDISKSTANMLDPLSRPSKRSKYTKKRRAPEAPALASMGNTSSSVGTDVEVPRNTASSADQPKPMHFAKNSDRMSKIKPHTSSLAQNQHQNTTFSRGNQNRNSANVNHAQRSPNEPPKYVYRREKSSDAILLKSRNSAGHGHSELRRTTTNDAEQQPIRSNAVQSKLKTTSTNTNFMQKEKVEKLIIPVQADKVQRTFYFGMDMPTPAEDVKQSAALTVDDKQQVDVSQLTLMPSYDIEYKKPSNQEESHDDNGLLVHIHPTLPRRQIETPSFSPALAWRSLVEEQDRLDKMRKMQAAVNSCESTVASEKPILPSCISHARQLSRPNQVHAAWTPEQDLAEEKDDRHLNNLIQDDSSSDEYRSKCEDGFLFYGSKTLKPSQDNTTNLPIHTFSLSLPRDAHINHTRSNTDRLNAGDVCIYKSLQKSKPDYTAHKNSSATAFSPRNSGSRGQIHSSNFEGSNNWLLHKNNSGVKHTTKHLDYFDKEQRLVSIEPQSITYLTGGKHVMYLPGSDNQAAASSRPHINVETDNSAGTQPKNQTNRHFKSRQRHVPQSLQDETPIFPLKSTHEQSFKLDEEKPFHQRFSFNNPVRLLEKSLRIEKSTKSNKIERSLAGELEALKKVEEDFQRNRANEKENIQHQLRLHFGNESEQYHSLPISRVVDGFSAFNLNDTNNNLFCRDDPEGCVSNVPFVSHESEEHKTVFGATNMLS